MRKVYELSEKCKRTHRGQLERLFKILEAYRQS